MHDEIGGTFGLTVIVGGQVVSGTAIGASTWRGAIASQREGAVGSEYMRERFDQVAEGNGDDATHRTDADLPVRTRRFLHMRDVIVGSSAETSLLFWRGSSMTYQLVARAALSSDQRPGAARS